MKALLKRKSQQGTGNMIIAAKDLLHHAAAMAAYGCVQKQLDELCSVLRMTGLTLADLHTSEDEVLTVLVQGYRSEVARCQETAARYMARAAQFGERLAGYAASVSDDEVYDEDMEIEYLPLGEDDEAALLRKAEERAMDASTAAEILERDPFLQGLAAYGQVLSLKEEADGHLTVTKQAKSSDSGSAISVVRVIATGEAITPVVQVELLREGESYPELTTAHISAVG